MDFALITVGSLMELHKSVMLNEVINIFKQADCQVRRFFDGTFGYGGHSLAVLKAYSGSRIRGHGQRPKCH